MTTFLIGFMGSGKSTIASLLSADFVDMDTVIVDKIGMPIADFFAQFGERRFREIESQVLQELTTSGRVIATGGGVVVAAENRRILHESTAEVIYLKADFSELYRRISADRQNVRPIFENNSRADLQLIFDKRVAFYEEIASKIITVTGKSPCEIVKEIQT
ncbi:shikimate kinase [Lactococcus hodotermopsidis]|uniref:Shikimate kinase n=1 Tax=Pseudolactococcus hodotermopsidis TaxID=2709157 RepID=A0A6A0B962_9LACT|nr:shikimate kinase [Lactococcus hodotermopsidis]GFH41970.1 shikimate kinase [Lactococcus hodotermopsidis]